jgi:hypothetical protein
MEAILTELSNSEYLSLFAKATEKVTEYMLRRMCVL